MFHKKLNINGKDYPVAVNISGHGAPTTSTEGAVDMLYRNKDDNSVYQCIAASGGVYTWIPFVSSGANGGSAYEIVSSVDEMTDTSKQYVLKSTGTIWKYQSGTVTADVTDTIDGGLIENSRMGSDGSVSTGDAYAGYVATNNYIDLKAYPTPFTLYFENFDVLPIAEATYTRIAAYTSDKTNLLCNRVTATTVDSSLNVDDGNVNSTDDGEGSITFTEEVKTNVGAEMQYIRVSGICNDVSSAKIYAKYQKTTTGYQWIDTGVPYSGQSGGVIDGEILAKIKALNNEGASPATIKLLSAPVLDFLNAGGVYDSTNPQAYPFRADIPVPYTVKWEYNENAMRTIVAVDDTKSIGTLNRFTMRTYNATGLNKFPIYNLLPNHTYYYRVTHVMADGSLVVAKNGSFTTSDETVRFIHIDGTQNVRDLGGWTGLNGKTVKYSQIFRGATFSDSSFPELIVTGHGKRQLADLKIQAELNLGAADTETSIAANVTYTKIGYSSYVAAITDKVKRELFKSALEWIVTQLTSQKPIYMHCQGGCDRTGTLSFQLLGLLGVSEDNLATEYELSSFSDIGFGRYRTSQTYNYSGMVDAIKEYSGDTLADKFYSFAMDCGISAETVTNFRDLMLE